MNERLGFLDPLTQESVIMFAYRVNIGLTQLADIIRASVYQYTCDSA